MIAASIGGIGLAVCVVPGPAAAVEPLRVTPAVQIVQQGQNSGARVVLTGHHGHYYGGGFYGGGFGGYGYRSFGYGPRFGLGYSPFIRGGLYRSSFYSPYGYGLYRPYSSFGIYSGYRPGFGAYYSSYRPGFRPYYSGFYPGYYGYASYGYPAAYAYPSVYTYAYRPYSYSYATPVYAIPTYGYTTPIYSGTSLYGGYYWNGCY
jgi:hypothetical protein